MCVVVVVSSVFDERPLVKPSCMTASSRSWRCPGGGIVVDALMSTSSAVCGEGGDEAMAGGGG